MKFVYGVDLLEYIYPMYSTSVHRYIQYNLLEYIYQMYSTRVHSYILCILPEYIDIFTEFY